MADNFFDSFQVIRPYTPPQSRKPEPEPEDDFFQSFEPVRDVPPAEPAATVEPRSKPEPEPQDDFLQSFEYVRDVPTIGGYAREAGKEIIREVPKAAIASPLKGIGALQAENQRRANETLLFPIMRSAAAKLKDPKTRDEAIAELEGYRDSFSIGPFNTYGLNKSQKAALGVAVEKAKAGETDPEKLMSDFEGIKPKPVEERAAYKAGSKLEKLLNRELKRTPGYEDSTTLDIAGAVGSTGGSIAQGLVLGPFGMVAATALQGIDEQLSRAKEAGLKSEEAAKFAVQGAGPGAIGTLSVEYILRKVPPVVRQKLLKAAVDVAGAGAAEAVTEGIQQMIQNRIEMQYNPERKIFDGTAFAAGLGGSAGMVLRGIVLGATRGRGGRPDGGRVDPLVVQQELAQEELKLRQEEATKTPPTPEQPVPAPQKAATPAEAAAMGETRTVGKPITVQWIHGERTQGTIRAKTETGGYEIVDRDGVVSNLDPADLEVDPESGKAAATIHDGWKEDKPDTELEKNLAEWMNRENPWTKVTVETTDGVKFKAVEGPTDATGQRTFRDGNGDLQTFKPDFISVTPDWSADALPAPQPKIGAKAEALAKAKVITPEDEASPLPTADIAAGYQAMAEGDGINKANTILRTAGIPEIGTPVMIKGDDGKTERAVINDASEGYVEILTEKGANRGGKIDDFAKRITAIPEEAAQPALAGKPEEARTGEPLAGEETGIPLPEFLRPGGRLEPTTEARIETPVGENIPSGSIQAVTEPRIETPAGVTVPAETISAAPEARVQAPQGEVIPEEQISAAPEPGIEASTPVRSIASTSTGISVPVRYEIRSADSLATSVDQAELLPEASNEAPIVSEDGVVESGNGRVAAIRKAFSEDNAAGYVESLKAQGYPVEGVKNPVLVRVREGETVSRAKSAITEPPEATVANRVRISRPQAEQASAPLPEPSETTSTRSVPLPAKAIPEFTQRGNFAVAKNGRGFRTQAEAASVANSLGGRKKGFTVTQDAITENRGWVVKQERPAPMQASEPSKLVEKYGIQPAPAKPAKPRIVAKVPRQEFQEAREGVDASLRLELDKLGLKDIKLSTPRTITDKSGKKAAGADANVGRSVDDLIEVALSGDHDRRKTLRHEAVHAMRNLGLFKDAEWKTLERDAKASKQRMASIERRYAGEGLSEEALVEEAIADTFADYADGTATPKGFARTAFERVKNFLKALGNALKGNGFQSASDVFQSMESGEVGARPRSETKAQIARTESASATASAEIDEPSGRILSKERYSKLAKEDPLLAKDMGIFRKWIISPRTIAAFSKSFVRVYNVSKSQFAARQTITSNLVEEYRPYQKLKRPAKDRVGKVLELGRLEQKVFKPAADGTFTVTATNRTETMQAGESITLDAKEVEAYQSVRSAMDKALDVFKEQTVRDFGFNPAKVRTATQAMAQIGPETKKAQADKIRTLARMMNDIEQAKRAGYVPFTRFGNVAVVAERIDPKTGQSTTLHAETIEARGVADKLRKFRGKSAEAYPEVRALMAKLKLRYPGAKVMALEVGSPEYAARPSSEKDVLSEMLMMPPNELDAAREKLHSEVLAKGFRKQFLGAKNIPGYSVDLERSIADYIIGLGGFVARRSHYKQWDDAIKAIPSTKEEEIKYAKKYREYVNNPVEEFAFVRQTGFVMMLMGNVSNGIANMTQVPLVTAPYLSMFANVGRVEFELARAYKDVAFMLGSGKGKIFNPDKAPADVREDLKTAWEAGEFSPMAVNDIMGIAYKSRPSTRTLSAATRKLIDYIAIPQTGTERLNRLVTYIAAHRIASRPGFEEKAKAVLKDNALATKEILSDFSPHNVAKFLVDETQFDVGKINRATVMRSYGAAILQFKPFIAHSLELQFRLAKLHGWKGRKAFGLMMLGMIGSAGLWAVPFSDDAAYFLELAMKWWDGEDRDLKASLRETLAKTTGSPFIAEMATNGSIRGLGVDMTNRIGLGKIIPRSWSEAGGVPASLVMNRGKQALTSAKEGDVLKATHELLSPLLVQNFIQPHLWAKEGVRTKKGDVVMPADEISTFDMTAKSFGFNPATVADRYEMEWSQQRAGRAVQEKTTRYTRNMARALNNANNAALENDDAEVEKQLDRYYELLDEIEKHNDKAIENDEYHRVIVINERSLKSRMKAEEQGRGAVRAKTAPLKARDRIEELRRVYGAGG